MENVEAEMATSLRVLFQADKATLHITYITHCTLHIAHCTLHYNLQSTNANICHRTKCIAERLVRIASSYAL